MTEKLNLESNLADPDAVYQAIIEMHKDLSDNESVAANAKLVLMLANHIGDPEVIAEALKIARRNTLDGRPTGEGRA